MPTAEDVLHTRFTQVQVRQGFQEQEVDELLEDVVASLRSHDDGGPTSERPASQRPDSWAATTGESPRGEGLGARVLRVLRGDPRP